MDRTINYSIIIPHKNSVGLLKRCLDSIPDRDDIEIIVVDDNSHLTPEEINEFPGINKPRTQVLFTMEGFGAGYARNVGIKHAKGKYLLFADADDFFSEELEGVLNEAVGCFEDIIFFKLRSVLSDDISKPMKRCDEMNTFVDDYLTNECCNVAEMQLRCLWCIPVAKLIKKELIDRNNIRFSEVRYANDIFFSIQAGILAKEVRAISNVAYVVTVRENSLTSDFCGTSEEFRVRLGEALKVDSYIEKSNINFNCGRIATKLLWCVYYEKGCRYMWHCCINSLFYPKVFITISMFLLKRMIKTIIK